MKKNLILVIAFFLLTSAQAQKQKLELNLVKGETYSQNFNSNVLINQNLNGQNLKINMTIIGKTTYKVVDISGLIYNMEVKYESLSMKMALPNGVMEFSSEKNDEKDIFSTLLAELKGKIFIVKMTKTGKIKEVQNIESLFSSMFDKFPQLTDLQKQQIKEQLMQAYGEKAFKGNFEMVTALFPKNRVSVGKKWTISINLESGIPTKMNTIYELKEVNDSYYLIEGKSEMKTVDKDAYIQSNGMPLKYDLTGTMVSNIKINKKNGWIMSATINSTLDGTAYVKENPKMPNGMTIPMSVKNEMTIME